MPRDANRLASVVVSQATGAESKPKKAKNAAAVALGRLGGVKGGPARAAKLTPRRRSNIAKRAARARWKKNSKAADAGS